MDPDAFSTLDGGEHGPTALEDSHMQGKRLQVRCEIGKMKLWGGVTTNYGELHIKNMGSAAHVFDVQLREF